MEDKKNNWKLAIEVFTRVSAWIVAPIVLALIFGKILDTRYGTTPWIFLLLTGIAFFVSSFGIYKVIKRYVVKIEQFGKNNNHGN